jgi:hypothetical protein
MFGLKRESMAVDSPPTSWDVVQSSEHAGVRVTWLRRRGGEGDPGHVIRLAPLADDEATEELGPYERKQAAQVYDAIGAALLAAARQQRARLRGIMQRGSKV